MAATSDRVWRVRLSIRGVIYELTVTYRRTDSEG